MNSSQSSSHDPQKQVFSGNIYIFHAFDIAEDINLEKLKASRNITAVPLSLPKYFRRYYTPLAVELPHPHESARCISSKIHSFGALSLTYQIPFTDTLDQVRTHFDELYNQFQEQSITDAKSIFKRIESQVVKPRFFQMQSSYVVWHVNPEPAAIDVNQLEKKYGGIITSTLRFETEVLSEDQKTEMLKDTIGYFRGDMIIVDTDAAFLYDAEPQEELDLFEFANLQQLELKYFDTLLDQRLTKIYESEGKKLPMRAYLPFISTPDKDPVTTLGKLRVDISVITERLEGAVKLAGEPYLFDLYTLIVKKLDLKNWQRSIDHKLDIIREVQTIYQNKIDSIREDMLSVLIILLIFIELIVGVLSYLK